MKIKINIEKEGQKTEKEFSLGLKSFVKKATNSVVKVAKKVENMIDSGELVEITGKHVESAIDKIDELTQKTQEHTEQIIDEVGNLSRKAEGYANHVVDLAKKTAEHASTVFKEENKNDNENNCNVSSSKDSEALEEKISQIPEGKTFTLAEYLDYTEEYKYDGINRNSYLIAKEFLCTIEFPNCSKTTTAFAIMLTLDKPSYKKISQNMPGLGLDSERIIEDLKKNFEIWLNERPDIKKYCPNANLWQLLVYFRNKVNEALKNLNI